MTRLTPRCTGLKSLPITIIQQTIHHTTSRTVNTYNAAMHYDLHCHTTASDGQLSPQELLCRAAANGIDCLAITDHDTTAAYHLLDSNDQRLQLITGIELSTQWRGINVHIVGLNFDLNSSAILEAVNHQQQIRLKRAEKIAEKLAKVGFTNTLEGATSIAGNSTIGRPHFAQHLVDTGAVSDLKLAFKKYLGSGKAGDVKQLWPSLRDVVHWIREANGIAVLAHPAKYKLTYTKLGQLCDDFIEVGGLGFEISSGLQLPAVTRQMARLCQQKGLLASCGSDFHQPGQQWAELGRYSALPEHVETVWQSF